MINIYDNFNQKVRKPLENNHVCNELNEIKLPYEGLITFQKSDGKFYKYLNGEFKETLIDYDISATKIENNTQEIKQLSKSPFIEGSWCINKTHSNGTHYTVIFIPKEYPLQMGMNLVDGKAVGIENSIFANNNDIPICINAGRCFDNEEGTEQYFSEPTIFNGTIYQETNTSSGQTWSIGIKDGTFTWFKRGVNATDILNNGFNYCLGGFNPFIINGLFVNDIEDTEKYFPNAVSVPYPRQAIARDQDGNHYIFSCDGKYQNNEGLTYLQVAEILLQDYGVYNAYMLDGGGSVSTIYDGIKQTYNIDDKRRTERKMSTFLYFKNDNQSALHDAILKNNINIKKIDNNDLYTRYVDIWSFNNLILDTDSFTTDVDENIQKIYNALPSYAHLTVWLTTDKYPNLHTSISNRIKTDLGYNLSSTAFLFTLTKNVDINIPNQITVIPNDRNYYFSTVLDSTCLSFSRIGDDNTANNKVLSCDSSIQVNQNLTASKINNRVFIDGDITLPVSKQLLITTLPEGYRPKYTQAFFVPSSGTDYIKLSVNSNGSVYFISTTSSDTTTPKNIIISGINFSIS